MIGAPTFAVHTNLDGWQRFEEVDDDDGSVMVVRWARGTEDTAPGLDFVLEQDGSPDASTLEVDRGVSLAEVAAILALESNRGLPS